MVCHRITFSHPERGLEGKLNNHPQQIEIEEVDHLAVEIKTPGSINGRGEKEA